MRCDGAGVVKLSLPLVFLLTNPWFDVFVGRFWGVQISSQEVIGSLENVGREDIFLDERLKDQN